jgi:hypothetical protein
MQPRRATRYEVPWTIGLIVGEGVLLGTSFVGVLVIAFVTGTPHPGTISNSVSFPFLEVFAVIAAALVAVVSAFAVAKRFWVLLGIQLAVAVVLAWRLVPALDWTHISG